jgi:hypothetical protein
MGCCCLLPQMQRVDIGWFYRYSDAEGYAKTLRQLDPQFQFEIVFDISRAERQELTL